MQICAASAGKVLINKSFNEFAALFFRFSEFCDLLECCKILVNLVEFHFL